MIAWMAARSDGNNYGSLIEYNFPKQTLVYGPSQIEARIDQEPKISEQITLWSQSGSKVIRGNLITLPINGSLLYVEPIYLRAETEALPQLEKVVVVYDKSVVMADTFDGALQQIFGTQSAQQEQEAGSVLTSAPSKPFVQLAQEALNTHTEAESAARNGDWAKFGQLQEKLKTTLQKLTQQKSDVNQQ